VSSERDIRDPPYLGACGKRMCEKKCEWRGEKTAGHERGKGGCGIVADKKGTQTGQNRRNPIDRANHEGRNKERARKKREKPFRVKKGENHRGERGPARRKNRNKKGERGKDSYIGSGETTKKNLKQCKGCNSRETERVVTIFFCWGGEKVGKRCFSGFGPRTGPDRGPERAYVVQRGKRLISTKFWSEKVSRERTGTE